MAEVASVLVAPSGGSVAVWQEQKTLLGMCMVDNQKLVSQSKSDFFPVDIAFIANL